MCFVIQIGVIASLLLFLRFPIFFLQISFPENHHQKPSLPEWSILLFKKIRIFENLLKSSSRRSNLPQINENILFCTEKQL